MRNSADAYRILAAQPLHAILFAPLQQVEHLHSVHANTVPVPMGLWRRRLDSAKMQDQPRTGLNGSRVRSIMSGKRWLPATS